MKPHVIELYTPFAEYDEYLPDFNSGEEAIAWIKENDWAEQIDRNGEWRFVAKKLKGKRYRATLLTSTYIAQFDEITTPMEAFEKSGLGEYIKRGMPYAIYYNGVCVKEVV